MNIRSADVIKYAKLAKRGIILYQRIVFSFWPELVAHQAVHDEVCRGDEAEEDVRHEAEQMIPDREALAQVTLLNTGPDGVNDDDIIHHDDDPGQAAEDEDDSNHDED